MSGTNEWVPWYRRKEYKGNLTEEEKRHIDSFRLSEKNPAVAVEDLPEEVLGYLTELELAVYDKKQEGVANLAFVQTGIGALVIFLAYVEFGLLSPLVGYAIGCSIIAWAWLNYFRKWKANADALWIEQEGEGVPFSRTEEKLQEYWESDAISRFRNRSEVGDADEFE